MALNWTLLKIVIGSSYKPHSLVLQKKYKSRPPIKMYRVIESKHLTSFSPEKSVSWLKWGTKEQVCSDSHHGAFLLQINYTPYT